MSHSPQSRDHLVSARVALFDADLALAMGNPRAARIQIDLAHAYLAEVSQDLRIDICAPAGRSSAAAAEVEADARVEQARQAAVDQASGLDHP